MALPGANPLTSVLAAVLVGLAGIRFAYFAAGVLLLAVALSSGRVLWPITGRTAQALGAC
jgi:hypothetical protein